MLNQEPGQNRGDSTPHSDLNEANFDRAKFLREMKTELAKDIALGFEGLANHDWIKAKEAYRRIAVKARLTPDLYQSVDSRIRELANGICYLYNAVSAPFRLTVFNDIRPDGSTHIRAIATSSCNEEQREVIENLLMSALEAEKYTLVCEWGKYREMVHRMGNILGRISLELDLPASCDQCSFEVYKSGQMIGKWRFIKESGEAKWLLKAH